MKLTLSMCVFGPRNSAHAFWHTYFLLGFLRQTDITSTVEPQGYRLHSYGILGQPDTDIEYIIGKYHQKNL